MLIISSTPFFTLLFCIEVISLFLLFFNSVNLSVKLCFSIISSSSKTKEYPSFSKELAFNLNIPYIDAVEKAAIGKEQKSINNSIHQQRNIEETIKIHPESIFNKTILLTDDIINSGWSFTVIAAMLLKAGAKAVYPFAILSTGLRTEE